jgi:hypothetical protein
VLHINPGNARELKVIYKLNEIIVRPDSCATSKERHTLKFVQLGSSKYEGVDILYGPYEIKLQLYCLLVLTALA